MKEIVEQVLPLARSSELIVQELPDETLVYDLNSHKAHCLNKSSALVWKHCDGKTTAAEMTRILRREFTAPVDEDVVWLALGQLRKFRLLEGDGHRRAPAVKVSRRDLVRKYLPAALTLLPLIISVASPPAAQASSHCREVEEPCGGPDDPPCCGTLQCFNFSCIDP